MDYIITTEHLTKKYKNFTSVNHVSLHIRKGSIYGFLGPNGCLLYTSKIVKFHSLAQFISNFSDNSVSSFTVSCV